MKLCFWSNSPILSKLTVLLLACYISPALAAFVEFSNCLDGSVVNSNPRVLQFVPLNVSAIFDAAGSRHNLNITVYGNVTGQLYQGAYPLPNDTSWDNPNSTVGKIVNVLPQATLATTLFSYFNVLSYTPYSAEPENFCDATVNKACPIGPAFYRNSTQLDDLPGYSVAHDLFSTYAFTTIAATTKIQSGANSQFYGCVTAYITPDLGDSLRALIRYLPLGILVVVGVATIAAAMFSPWGSLDIFHWTSNFGRDEDVLRLVTPGFADCLQYIQFVVLTGSLSLNYPGFYQPIVSRVGWSTLLFNESLVSGGDGISSIIDGLYVYRTNTDEGLDRMTQLIGMASPRDAWADMMVWLVVIVVCVLILTQVGFLLRWVYRQVMHVPAEDLRSKNWYFCVGNVVRVTMGFFLLPLIAISMYQFVIAGQGPTVSVALAAVIVAAIIAFTTWLILLFVRTRPRSFLFDDLQTVLAYGPLYNTYRDDTATFALVPILINFVRGIAIGAVQQSGIAQVVLLAICEVVMVLTINAFRPFPSATSMNVYQTCFSIIRLLTVLLLIAFVPSLNVDASSRGWIGYAILLIHACVLVFGFFLNAIQTLIEVIARLAGAGGSGARDAARGGLTKVFGMRQLSKRLPRRGPTSAHTSMASTAQMLAMQDVKNEAMSKTRSRSVSASSTMLLDAGGPRSANRASQIIDGSSGGRLTPDAASTFSGNINRTSMSPGGIVGIQKRIDPKDPYYRPPRRNTNDLMSQGRPSVGGKIPAPTNENAIEDGGQGSSTVPVRGDEHEEIPLELTNTTTDYAVREVDFYYGVRGPALSSGTRKLKTGPADPTGPVSSARGWFKGLIGGKTKEKGKGFEVVRSARALPPGMLGPSLDPDRAALEPYHDHPEANANNTRQAGLGRDGAVSPESNYRDFDNDSAVSDEEGDPTRSHRSELDHPPSLPRIDTGGDIELPSRIGSKISHKKKLQLDPNTSSVPPVPRRSSRRLSTDPTDSNRNSLKIPPAVATSPNSQRDSMQANESPSRLPFSSNRQSRHSLAFSDTSSHYPQTRHSVAYSEVSNFYPHHDYAAEIENQPPVSDEQATSMGVVSHHQASDSIKQSTVAENATGRSAEYGYSEQQNPSETWSPSWNGSSAVDSTTRLSRFRD